MAMYPQATETTDKVNDAPVLNIIGRVESPLSFTKESLHALDTCALEEMPMHCGSGERKGTFDACRGVLLSDLINQAQVIVTAHNDTKKMFVVAASDDGYKAVFSWQEIFNSPNGDKILVVLERDGQSRAKDRGDFDLISGRDHLAGPRYVRQLRTVEICMVE